ncbi:MAG: hypothetical protein WCQ53_05535, partial [bacterium]
ASYKGNFTDMAKMYMQHNNFFTTTYKAAYLEAQKLNIENYIYQDYAYLRTETDVREKAGKICNATEGDCFEKVFKHGTAYLAELKLDKSNIQKTDAQIKQEFDDFKVAVNKAREVFNEQLRNTRQDGSEKLETESDSDGPYLQPSDFATLKEYSKALLAYFATAKGQEQIADYQKQISYLASEYPAARFIIQGFNLYDIAGIPGMRQQYYVDPVKEAEKVADIKNVQAHHSVAYGETFDSPAQDNIGAYKNANADLLYPAPDVCSIMTGSASTCQGQIKTWIDAAQEKILDYGEDLADKYSDFASESSTKELENFAAEQVATLLMTQPLSIARTLGGSGYAESTILVNSSKIIKTEIANIKADKERQEKINSMFAYVGMVAGIVMIATGVGSWAGAAIFGAIGPTMLTTIYAVNMVAMVGMAVSAYQQIGALSGIKKQIDIMSATGNIKAADLSKLTAQQQSMTLSTYITIALMPLDILMVPQIVGFVGALAKGGRYLETFVAFGKAEAVVMKELEAIHGEKKVTNFWFYMKMSGKSTEEIAAMAKDEELMNGISDLLDAPLHRRIYKKINKKINTITEAETAKKAAAAADKKTTATTKSTSNDVKKTTKNNTEDLTKKTTNETDKAPVVGSGVTSALKTDYEGVFSKFGITDSEQSRKTLDYMMNNAYTKKLTQEDILGMSKTDFIGEFGQSERNSKSIFKPTATEFDLAKIKAKWSDKLPKIEEALKAPISATGEGNWMRSIGQADIIKWLDKFGTLKKSTIFSTVKIEGQEIQIGDAVLEKARQYAYDMTKGKFDFEVKGYFVYKDAGTTKEITDFMPVESVSVSFPSNEMLVGTSVQSSKASAGTGATQYTYLRGDLNKAFEESIFGAVDKSGKYKGPGEFPKNIDVHSHPYYSPFQKAGSGADYRKDMRAIITPGKDKDDFNLLFVKTDVKDTKLTEIIPMTAKNSEATTIAKKYDFKADDPLLSDEILGKNITYNSTLKMISEQTKKNPILLESNGALLFHGSNSSSLLAFTKYGNYEGRLLPTGKLLEEGKVPFTGEITVAAGKFNKDNLSTTFINNMKTPVDYSGRVNPLAKKWNPEIGNKEVEAYNSGFRTEEAKKNMVTINQKRIEEWPKLTTSEKELVEEPFSVIYGIKTKPGANRLTAGSMKQEVGISGGVEIDEIKSIFVPQNKIDFVKDMLAKTGKSTDIKVLPIEKLDPSYINPYKVDMSTGTVSPIGF